RAPYCCSSSGSAVVLAIEIADARRERGEQLHRDGRMVLDDAPEVPLVEDEQRAVALADGARRARPVGEQCELANDVARSELGDLAIASLDGHLALQDDERFATELTLVDDDRAVSHRDLVAGTVHGLQLSLAATSEERDVPQVLELSGLGRHGGTVAGASGPAP